MRSVFQPAFAAGLIVLAGRCAVSAPLNPDSVTALNVPSTGQPGFTLMEQPQIGVAFTNTLDPAAELANINLAQNGSGIALGDFDNDGWCDVFLCSLSGTCGLYRNLGGWRFEDASIAAGLVLSNQLARGAVFADVDGDRDLDLLITFSGRGTKIFLNDGGGRFHDSGQVALEARTGSLSLALGDLDGDGDLDLYVANYGENTIRSGLPLSTRMVRGQEQVVGRMRNRLQIIGGMLVEHGEPDTVYWNDGQGRFKPVSWTDGVFLDEGGRPLRQVPWELGLTATIRDVNQDGFADIYVCNDFQDPDRIWLGDGRGHFRPLLREAMRSSCNASMAVDFADINRDGFNDFFVTEMLGHSHDRRMRQSNPAPPPIEHTREPDTERPQVHRNHMYLNRGDGTYAEIANFAGLAASDWTWCVAFLDVDLDGFEDVLLGTGNVNDTIDLDAADRNRALPPDQNRNGRLILSLFPPLRTPNLAFRNRGDLTFKEMGNRWGFDSPEVSHSMALGDLDNDGDLDVVINCFRAPALFYRNDCAAPRVSVRLDGAAPNTQAIGARVVLRNGAVPSQSKELFSGGRFLAGDQVLCSFAAGSSGGRMQLEVRWPNGKVSRLDEVEPNHQYRFREPVDGDPPTPSPARDRMLWFEDASNSVSVVPTDAPYDDFAEAGLLHRRFSNLGPGITWFDLNGDQLDDLVVGAGRNGSLAVLLNEGGGRFLPSTCPLPSPLPADATSVLGWGLGDTRGLWMGLSTAESLARTENAVLGFLNQPGSGSRLWSATTNASSVGPLALGDMDGDGRLELFAGGRLVAGHYPDTASSRVFRFDGTNLTVDPTLSEPFEHFGLVTAAVFTDLDNDGRSELVLACEWGPIRVFQFTGGTPLEVTQSWGLSDRLGLWTSVTAEDFDGDGYQDLAVGNWGLNSLMQLGAPGPWYLYSTHSMDGGPTTLVEAYRDPSSGRILPCRQRSVLETRMPWLKERFPTHEAYSHATVDEILGGQAIAAPLEANTLSSGILLNRRGTFEWRPLPAEAQWSSAMGITSADFNGDGRLDLFISQNFFGLRPEDGRLDSGRGLLLEGDGGGGFRPVPGQESGVRVYGEQRGCAFADYDADGRMDIAVAQYGGSVKLFRNVMAPPGITVRLAGPPQNPTGVGAALWMEEDGRTGPAWQIHAGSGWCSQDSCWIVFAPTRGSARLHVRWPGGATRTYPIATGSGRVVVHPDGRIDAMP